MSITYEILCEDGSLYPQIVGPIRTARTAKTQARVLARRIAGKIYITWHRDEDGQTGYLNPDGNDITGKAWD